MAKPQLTKLSVSNLLREYRENQTWLSEQMSPYFFQAMADEQDAMAILVRELGSLRKNHRLILSDRPNRQILACVDQAGSLYESMCRMPLQDLSYAMFSHSAGPMPGMNEGLEVQRFDFDRKPDSIAADLDNVELPASLLRRSLKERAEIDPGFDRNRMIKKLKLLWLNNPEYIQISSSNRIAWLCWLLENSIDNGDLYVDLRTTTNCEPDEVRLLFAVGNPPQDDFLLQVMDLLNRMEIDIMRSHFLNITNGVHPYFLGTFILRHRKGESMLPGTPFARRLKRELANTQILDNHSYAYREWVTNNIMSGNNASLANAFMAFCHTTLAHSQPDVFDLEEVQNAFHAHPEITLQLVRLFKMRFDPKLAAQVENWQKLYNEAEEMVADYNTGHGRLDELRRTVYHCCLLMIRYTLKTNFFVSEKQALAFRLDPAYLRDLGRDFTADLPAGQQPFRITFFYSRFGHGYHIGFGDIARGGWRTVIARSTDDAATIATNLFKEAYVLASTQHLKNKDIYEGGSKMVLMLDASDLCGIVGSKPETCRLYKLQHAVANAFFDLFVTKNGKAADPRIVDYYGDDEAIELGPDENMHDSMIETIAALSVHRGYMLGIGVISSKEFGINHKHYAVTSTGVLSFTAISMQETGIDIYKDPFTVKMTGGPGGDVAGNCLNLLLESCPDSKILMILDGTAAAYDPNGLNKDELRRIVLKHDLDAFNPEQLGTGGMLLLRTGKRMEELNELYRRFSRNENNTLTDEWVHLDDFYREYSSLAFTVQADLFIPGGGRPETINDKNWRKFMLPDGQPSSKVIIEGANSFITPDARTELQRNGVLLMRDASANKCGVISSSYEIIANLLLSEQEFSQYKERYVTDVLTILQKRATDEASLILRLYKENGGALFYTEISDQISHNINNFYNRLFRFFIERPELSLKPPFKKALLRHLPALLREKTSFRQRVDKLPVKYRAAMLAAEVGASLVYSSSADLDFEDMVRCHLVRAEQENCKTKN
ncbi:MAG: NAD-glutamate dehydrogenase [Trichlorobacter sp.]|nr:NAD-glutamate dehydrogenase [Trichlorobacter sp.]